MPQLWKIDAWIRFGDALADLVRGVLEGLAPSPDPVRIPVRVKERR